MKFLNRTDKNKLNFLGYYQIFGGIWGLILVIRLLIYEQSISGLGLLFYSMAISLFTFSIYCGNLLRKNDNKGLFLSTLNQACQVIQFQIGAIGFEYYAGINFNIGFQWTSKFSPSIHLLLTGWQFRYTEGDTNHLSVYINLIPLLIIYLIIKIEERNAIMKLANSDSGLTEL